MIYWDYTLNWKYIVDKMEEKFGLKPDSTEKLSMGEIERKIEEIWVEYVDILDKKYTEAEIVDSLDKEIV